MPSYLSLKDHVYKYISDGIKNGKLKPNEKINEKQIMRDLQISSTPVREALIELTSQGILKNMPRKGFFVQIVDQEKVNNLYQIIGTLDALCATLSLDYLTEADHLSMSRSIEKMDKAIRSLDFDIYYEEQHLFHDKYCKRCHNDELIQLLHQLKRRFIRQSYENIDNDHLIDSLLKTNEEHKMILQLIIEKNSSQLEDYIRNTHWCNANSYFDLFE